MPLILDVELRHGLHLDAKAAHHFVIKPCSQPETRTLYHLHDLAGTHLTIVTDDLKYDPRTWGHHARQVRQREYQPQPVIGSTRKFLLRLNRERRVTGQKPFNTDEELDTLLTRLMDRAGAEVLEYTARFDAGYHLNSPTPNIPTATFEGTLKVMDTSLMHTTLLQGLGRTKRYGCGLLLTREIELLN